MQREPFAVYHALGYEGSIEKINLKDASLWGGLEPGTKLKELDALFPRIVKDKKKTKDNNKDKKKEKPVEEEGKDNLIKIDDFAKVELKTAVVKHAERVEGTDKLIRLEVDSGEERQIVAGIGGAYEPEDLIGKTIVVVANLKPAKLRGVVSEGMLLAAKTLARTGIELLQNPQLVEEAKAEFNERRGDNFSYAPLLGDRKPPLDFRD